MNHAPYIRKEACMFHVGLDVHHRTSTLCILDSYGREVKTKTVRGHWDTLLREIETLDQPFQICFEASCGYGHLYDQLARHAQRVVMAHPGKVRLIFRAKRKNDRIDARKLAKLLYLDEVPTAYVPRRPARYWREMIEYRQALVSKRVATKNQIRALLRSRGIASPRGLWTAQGLAWLAEVDLGDEMAALRRMMLQDELTHLSGQIRTVTKMLDKIGHANPGVGLLRTIPGVGPRTAEAIVAYVDDENRFATVHQAGAYFGLVPCQDASAGKNRLGRITKDGPGTARKLLVESAWQLIRRCPRTAARFERIVQGKPERRKKALVAIARHLATVMVSMLRSGEVWREAA